MTSCSERVTVPEAVRRNVVQVWGEPGRAWLDDLPQHLAACSARWSSGSRSS